MNSLSDDFFQCSIEEKSNWIKTEKERCELDEDTSFAVLNGLRHAENLISCWEGLSEPLQSSIFLRGTLHLNERWMQDHTENFPHKDTEMNELETKMFTLIRSLEMTPDHVRTLMSDYFRIQYQDEMAWDDPELIESSTDIFDYTI